jgi:hypothetical protein
MTRSSNDAAHSAEQARSLIRQRLDILSWLERVNLGLDALDKAGVNVEAREREVQTSLRRLSTEHVTGALQEQAASSLRILEQHRVTLSLRFLSELTLDDIKRADYAAVTSLLDQVRRWHGMLEPDRERQEVDDEVA